MKINLEPFKFSNYNHKIEIPEGVFLYNSLTGGFCKVDDDIKQIFINRDLSSEENLEYLEKLPNEIITELLRGGFLVDKKLDEFKLIKSIHNISRFSNNNTLGLTLLPTLGCNFRCTYCFEKDQEYPNEKMSDEVMNAVIKYIDENLQPGGTLAITWYGGEPLITFDIIKKLQTRINKLSQEKNLKLSSGMITNGYLLTEEVSNELVNLGIERIQVTIDGPKDIHDTKRILASGKGSFDKIISNLMNVNDKLFVSIRVNIEKNNIESVPEFLDYLNDIGLGKKKNIAPYFSIVRDYDTEKGYISNNCYSVKDFSKEELIIDQIAYDKGFEVRDSLNPNLSSCGAVSPNTILVEPDGTIQKCWNVVGDKEQGVGNILGSNIDYSTATINETKWYSWNAFEEGECKDCNVMPLCMGGCPYYSVNHHELFEKSRYRCVTAKYNLEETLKTLAYRHLSKFQESMEGGVI
jgi:uncharacterized protein